MKKKLTLIASFLFTLLLSAQNHQSEEQIMQSLYSTQKKEIISEFVEIDDSQNTSFWLLFNEYETKRKDLGTQKLNLLFNYANVYGDVDPENAEEFMSKIIPLRKNSDKLLDSYYKKIKKKTDPIVAMQFYQIEKYFSGLIRLELLEGIYITKEE